MDTSDFRESSLKELPTRELKLKRHKSRRDSPTLPHIRLRLKSNASSMNSETDTEKGFSDRSVSSSPDSLSQEHSPVFISSRKASVERICPLSPMINGNTSDSYETFNFSSFVDNDDYDQPLDMSKKRSESLSFESSSSHQQQLRPSVITCASALLRTQCNLTDVAHNVCTLKYSCDSNSNDMNDNHSSSSLPMTNESISEAKLRPGHRREIVSGSCDPVIDEHFRRSLGKDYQNIFSKSSGNNVSVTVDDHFAKALGETWHKLQLSKADNAVQSEHSTSPLQASKQTTFLRQPPEILS